MRLDGRYQLLEPLSRTGVGDVWRARDRHLGREVAITILRPDLAEDEAFRKAYRAYLRTQAAPHGTALDYAEATVDGEALAYRVDSLPPGSTGPGEPGGVPAPVHPHQPPSIALTRTLP
jgi:serine/threonine-protein kinase